MPNENVNVTTTNTFLDKTTPITMDDLKSQFQADDFSAAESGYDLTRQPTEKQKLYQRVKTLFDQAWENELKKLRGKSGKNYGADYPLKALEKSESELVAGTVMKITENPELHDKYMNAGTKAMMSRVNEIATEYEGREEETGVA